MSSTAVLIYENKMRYILHFLRFSLSLHSEFTNLTEIYENKTNYFRCHRCADDGVVYEILSSIGKRYSSVWRTSVFDSSPDSFRYLIMQAEVDITSASFILIGYRLCGLTLLFCESWGLLITSHTPNTTAGSMFSWRLISLPIFSEGSRI